MKTLRKRLISFLSVAVGGTTGKMIGHKMDKQAKEIEKTVPDATVERVGEGIDVEFSSHVLFGFDASVLSRSAKTNLDKFVEILNVYANTDIKVQGYNNDKRTKAHNLSLSQRRVGSVSTYLISKGIDGSRIKIEGLGESLPKYDNTTEDGRLKNRRVQFLITANQKMITEAEKESYSTFS